MTKKRTVLTLNVDPDTLDRYKHAAALQGKSVSEWAHDALEERLQKNEPAKDELEKALRIAEGLHPRILAGTKGPMDAADDLNALRNERLRTIGS